MSAGIPLNVHPALASILTVISGDALRAIADPRMADYRKKLAAHDWHYERADDHEAWLAGSRERAELMILQAELDPHKAVWECYAPEVSA